MSNEEYVNFCNGVNSCDTQSASAEAWDRLKGHSEIKLLHAGMGLVTESAEVMDALKKYVFYGKPIDRQNILEEAGDVLWYISILVSYLGVSIDDVMAANVNKLKERYKGSEWNRDGAITRDVDKEMEALGTASTTPSTQQV